MPLQRTPGGLVRFGLRANCTLELCPVEYSAFEYVPSLPANTIFLVLFTLSGLLHLYQGIRSRQWFYMTVIVAGCVAEIVGYTGRILLNQNPFDFNYFLIQIICLALAPAFYCASIYCTFTAIVNAVGPELSCFDPKWCCWVFIPCDFVSLVLQGTGGALSSSGGGTVGVNVSLAGLSFQVVTLCVFIGLVVEFMLRWRRHGTTVLTGRFKLFASLMSLAIILILARCAYRIGELSEGYQGSIFSDQASFVVLEGVFMTLAVFLLNVAHPSYVFTEEGELIGGRRVHKEEVV